MNMHTGKLKQDRVMTAVVGSYPKPENILPGPTTVVDGLADTHYQGNLEQMAMDYATAIRHEVGHLIKAGCQATFIVHICRGYPDKPLEQKGVVYKANADYYGAVLEWLSESSIDVVSIEGAQSNLDLSVLP